VLRIAAHVTGVGGVDGDGAYWTIADELERDAFAAFGERSQQQTGRERTAYRAGGGGGKLVAVCPVEDDTRGDSDGKTQMRLGMDGADQMIVRLGHPDKRSTQGGPHRRAVLLFAPVRLTRTSSFDDESERFSLRFCCEDCAYFDGSAARCRHDWPTELHRRAHYCVELPRTDAAGELVFCKEFELC
jgi:hypothetical protein